MSSFAIIYPPFLDEHLGFSPGYMPAVFFFFCRVLLSFPNCKRPQKWVYFDIIVVPQIRGNVNCIFYLIGNYSPGKFRFGGQLDYQL